MNKKIKRSYFLFGGVEFTILFNSMPSIYKFEAETLLNEKYQTKPEIKK